MGFTTKQGMVRVDFFKPSGKWYTTEEMHWDRYYSYGNNEDSVFESTHDTFKRCLREQIGDQYKGMIAICLEPYHEHSYPLMVTDW